MRPQKDCGCCGEAGGGGDKGRGVGARDNEVAACKQQRVPPIAADKFATASVLA